MVCDAESLNQKERRHYKISPNDDSEGQNKLLYFFFLNHFLVKEVCFGSVKATDRLQQLQLYSFNILCLFRTWTIRANKFLSIVTLNNLWPFTTASRLCSIIHLYKFVRHSLLLICLAIVIFIKTAFLFMYLRIFNCFFSFTFSWNFFAVQCFGRSILSIIL